MNRAGGICPAPRCWSGYRPRLTPVSLADRDDDMVLDGVGPEGGVDREDSPFDLAVENEVGTVHPQGEDCKRARGGFDDSMSTLLERELWCDSSEGGSRTSWGTPADGGPRKGFLKANGKPQGQTCQVESQSR